jgi:hypothetical protein
MLGKLDLTYCCLVKGAENQKMTFSKIGGVTLGLVLMLDLNSAPLSAQAPA